MPEIHYEFIPERTLAPLEEHINAGNGPWVGGLNPTYGNFIVSQTLEMGLDYTQDPQMLQYTFTVKAELVESGGFLNISVDFYGTTNPRPKRHLSDLSRGWRFVLEFLNASGGVVFNTLELRVAPPGCCDDKRRLNNDPFRFQTSLDAMQTIKSCRVILIGWERLLPCSAADVVNCPG